MLENTGNNSSPSQSPFERIKKTDPDGIEFWSARDLIPVLGYSAWQRMEPVFLDIYSSFCLENPHQNEIVRALKIVTIGSGALRELRDWHLSRNALDRVLSRVASQKPQAVRELSRRESQFRIEIELGARLFEFCEHARLSIVSQYPLENYRFDFCIAETLLIEVDERHHMMGKAVKVRDELKTQTAARHGFKLLRVKVPIYSTSKLCGTIFRILTNYDEETQVEISDEQQSPFSGGKKLLKKEETTLKNAGVITSQDFAIFQNHGYRGLYNGLTAEDIHKRKKLKKSQHILDHMGTTELAANLFRSTQAEEKLRRDNIQGKENANQVHYQAGVIVRRAIAELGGTMPEDLPTEESIKKLEQAEKKRLAAPKSKNKDE